MIRDNERTRLPETAENQTALIVYDGCPWPSTSGADSRVSHLALALARSGISVHLLCTTSPRPVSAPHKKINVSFYYPPTPRNRLRSIVQAVDSLLQRGNRTTLETILTSTLPNFRPLQAALDYRRRMPEGLPEHVASLASDRAADIVFVEYLWMAQAVDLVPTHVRRLIDIIDLQHRRAAEFRTIGLAPRLEVDASEEFSIYDRFDAVIAIQADEADALKAALRSAEVLVVGHATYEPADSYDPEFDVCFVGGTAPPTVHGLGRFLDEVWPQVVARRPGATFAIGGTAATTIEAHLSDLGVHAIGPIKRSSDLLTRSRIVVNPVWSGTGLKIKTVEALGLGQALITTPKGVEGMRPGPGSACVIETSPDRLASAIDFLLSNENARLELKRRAAAYAESHLSEKAVYAELLGWLKNDRPE